MYWISTITVPTDSYDYRLLYESYKSSLHYYALNWGAWSNEPQLRACIIGLCYDHPNPSGSLQFPFKKVWLLCNGHNNITQCYYTTQKRDTHNLTLNSKKKAVNHGNTKDTNNINRTAMASRISALLILSQVYRSKKEYTIHTQTINISINGIYVAR